MLPMKFRRCFLLLPFALPAQAFAQELPAPAPLPQRSTNAPKPVSEPLLLENPLPSESPIIIGEPVRRQTAPKPPTRGATTRETPVPRASVAGVSLSGLSSGAAIAKLKAAFEPRLREPVRLIIGGYQYTFRREELGASLPLWPLLREAKARGEVPFRLQIDEAKLERELRLLDKQVRQDFARTAINVSASTTRIKAALENSPTPASVELVTLRVEAAPVERVEPAVAPTPANGKFPFLLAQFSTKYDASLRGRTTNLKMAARGINGTIVAPNATFSANRAIGPRNAAAGWREAKMFVSGKVVSGTGAGICQASSTLYNAVLLADLPVVERHAHSMRVMYVPPSRDAALMWGSKDFRFRNTTGAPIRVETSVSGGQFHAKLWGQKARGGAPVRIVSRVVSRQGGTRSEAFKLIGDQRIRVSRDRYAPTP